MTDDLGEREPVRVTPRAGAGQERGNGQSGRSQERNGGQSGKTGQRDNRRAAAEKLARRLAGLPAGRYELVITIGDDGALADWSVRWFGKVEQP